jgi:hypothetical protein
MKLRTQFEHVGERDGVTVYRNIDAIPGLSLRPMFIEWKP